MTHLSRWSDRCECITINQTTTHASADMLGWCSNLGLSPSPVNRPAGEGAAQALGPPDVPGCHSSRADSHCPAVSVQNSSIAAELLSAHEHLPSSSRREPCSMALIKSFYVTEASVMTTQG